MSAPESKPAMLLKWIDEPNPRPISRKEAAHMILGNRRRSDGVNVAVFRKCGETHVVSRQLHIGCVIFRAAIAKATGSK